MLGGRVKGETSDDPCRLLSPRATRTSSQGRYLWSCQGTDQPRCRSDLLLGPSGTPSCGRPDPLAETQEDGVSTVEAVLPSRGSAISLGFAAHRRPRLRPLRLHYRDHLLWPLPMRTRTNMPRSARSARSAKSAKTATPTTNGIAETATPAMARTSSVPSARVEIQ